MDMTAVLATWQMLPTMPKSIFAVIGPVGGPVEMNRNEWRLTTFELNWGGPILAARTIALRADFWRRLVFVLRELEDIIRIHLTIWFEL